jgi:hypothetical protein
MIMKEKNNKKKEEGSVIILALMVLVLLSILGLSATQTSTIESQIVRNDILYKRAFCDADAGINYVLGAAPPLGSLTPTETRTPGVNDIPTPDDVPFKLWYAKQLRKVPFEEVEIISDSFDSGGQVTIVAGIRYPTPGGAMDEGGNPGDY